MRNGILVAVTLFGCTGDPAPIVPVDTSSYVEVRACRPSSDHNLNDVRVIVDPGSVDAYTQRVQPFATDAIVLKPEYDFTDTTCTGAILYWTVMQKLPVGSSPATLDWHWQQVDPKRGVTSDDDHRCISCHTNCGVAPDGYDGTCSKPATTP